MRGSRKTYCLSQEEEGNSSKKGSVVVHRSQLPRYRPKQDSHPPLSQGDSRATKVAKESNVAPQQQEVGGRRELGEAGGVTGILQLQRELVACKARLLDQDSEMKKLREESSSNLASIASSLRLLSVSLRKKNAALKQLIKEKDLVIHSQGEVIKRLRAEKLQIEEGGDSDSGVVLCDSEFSDATIELSDTAIDDLGEVNSRVRSDSTSKNGVVSERENIQQSLVKRVQLNHRSITKPRDVKYRRISKSKSKSMDELREQLRMYRIDQ